MRSLLLPIIGTLLLTCGCASRTHSSTYLEYAGTHFTIAYPPELTHSINRADGSIALTNNNHAPWERQPQDYFVAVYEQMISSSCSPLADGEFLEALPRSWPSRLIPSTITVKGRDDGDSLVLWGKDDVDYWLVENSLHRCGDCEFPATDANCQKCWDDLRKDKGYPPHRYLLCAERPGQGGKPTTILISIVQQTDDPGLAKQIFETFRWTGE